MREFFKMTFATMCGIVLLSVLAGIMFMISLVGMVAASSATTSVKDNSVFVLRLNGTVSERAGEENPLNSIMGQADMEAMGLDDLVSSIRKAKEQDDIKGIFIEGGVVSFDAPATAQQLRDALADFKTSGKWIMAFGDGYSQTAYYVASVADSVFLNRTGMIELKGMGGQRQYLTGLYEKVGVKYQPVRVGKYKSAVESVTRKSMSDEDREQTMAYLGGIWKQWLQSMAEGRGLTAERLDSLVSDSILAFANPDDYVAAGLVDRLMYPDEVKAVVKARLGIDSDDEINQLSLADMKGVPSKAKKKGDEVAVYYAYGEIVDEVSSLFSEGHNIVGSTVVADLNELAEDDDVKAVVLRVNSPGGSAVASEQIWHAIKQLKEKKPVVVSMGGLAASGGYMISAPASYIFAEPTTITGSIGIFGLVPNANRLATELLGLTFDTAKTNQYTDFEERLLLSGDNADILQFMQSYVDRGYDTFLTIVADGRPLSKEEVHEVAQGRVWLATDALPLKLIDALGSLDDAVAKAVELAGLEKYHTAAYPAPSSWTDNLFNQGSKDGLLDGELRTVLGSLYEPVMEMRRDEQRNRLQARLPYFAW